MQRTMFQTKVPHLEQGFVKSKFKCRYRRQTWQLPCRAWRFQNKSRRGDGVLIAVMTSIICNFWRSFFKPFVRLFLIF